MRTKTTHKTRHNGVHRNLKNTNHKITEARDALLNATGEARETLIGIEKNVARYTKQNPLKSMGFSLLAGLFVAQLFHLHR